MPSKGTKEKEEIKWIALLRIDWPGGSCEIKSFDAAWYLMLEKGYSLGTASSTFLRFVRKED